jgi:addiction module RelE/StbE family toxin
MVYNLSVMPIAYEDMDNIYSYISETLCAPLAAKNLLKKLIAEMNKLKTFPCLGEIQPQTDSLRYEYRRLIVENYIVFYIVEEEEKRVNIMRILYGAVNYMEIL